MVVWFMNSQRGNISLVLLVIGLFLVAVAQLAMVYVQRNGQLEEEVWRGRQLRLLCSSVMEALSEKELAKNHKSYEEYIKFLIGQALDAIGEEKVKGQFYGFKRTTSTTNKVDQETLDSFYLAKAEKALQDAGIPAFIHPVLKTTATELKDAGGDALAFLETTEAPAIGFTKPRASKD